MPTKSSAKKPSTTTKKRKKRGALEDLPLSPVRQQQLEQNREAAKLLGLALPGYRNPDHYGESDEELLRSAFEKAEDPGKIADHYWEALLLVLSKTGNVTKSCQMVGIKRPTVYRKHRLDAAFRKRFEEAHAEGISRLEDVAIQRAAEGVSKPVFFQGGIVGFTQEYSDQLIQFLLQGNKAKYRKSRDEELDPDGPRGGVLVVPAPLATDDWERAAMNSQVKLKEDVRK